MTEKYIKQIGEDANKFLNKAYDLSDGYTPLTFSDLLEAMKLAVLADISINLSGIASSLDSLDSRL